MSETLTMDSLSSKYPRVQENIRQNAKRKSYIFTSIFPSEEMMDLILKSMEGDITAAGNEYANK